MARPSPAVCRGDHGFTMVEVVVAVTLLALATVGFARSAGQGLSLVGSSKERQIAVQVANQWMEYSRVVAYDGLAHDTIGQFDGGPGTPDEDVDPVGLTYDGPAGVELLVLSAGSTLPHHAVESVDGIDFDVYRFVTWVADGSDPNAYKRVTVVVQWDGTDSADERVTLTTLMSGDGMTWTSTTTTVAPVSTTTTSSTTTTTAPPVCEGDATPPTGSVSILAGTGANTGYTASSTVTLSLSASDTCTPLTMQFSNDGVSYSEAEAFSTSKSWALASGDGDRTVWVRYADANTNQSVAQASIRVDGTPPTTPGSFTVSVYSGPKRAVLSWTGSTDNDTLIGYRVYRRRGGSGAFTALTPTVSAPCSSSPCTFTDNDVQNNESYTYYVVSYDAAGNESAATSERTVTI